jgi:gas vesicle protein
MSTENDQHTVIIEKEGRPEIGAFLLGALVGAGIALLFAPSSGEETQRRIREQARRLRALTEDRMRGLREFIEHAKSLPGVWWTTREEIAEWYLKQLPPAA